MTLVVGADKRLLQKIRFVCDRQHKPVGHFMIGGIMEKNVSAAQAPQFSETARGERAAHRFLVLDSWRGICALLIVLFHFPADNFMNDNSFMNSGFLAVDFFFVLSGFVVTSAYAARLQSPKNIKRFVFVRFGRLYPLHLFMLCAFAGFELLRIAAPKLAGGGDVPFSGPTNLQSLATNLLLIHGWGIESGLTWNSPSWSISAEFFAYLYFALVTGILPKMWRLPVLAAVIVAAPVVLVLYSPHYMDASFDYGLIRCLFGFSLGVMLYTLRGERIGQARSAIEANGVSGNDHLRWSVAEIAVVIAVIVFMTLFGTTPIGIASPLIFALAIHVFAHEAGLLSKFLLKRSLIFLGSISYSLYMVHIFIQSRIINAANFMERRINLGMIGEIDMHGLMQTGLAAGKPFLGLALTILMVIVVIIAASVTWRFIEMPALGWFRRSSKRIG